MCSLQVPGTPHATATLHEQITSAPAAPAAAPAAVPAAVEPGPGAAGASDEEEEEELDMSNVDAMMAEEGDLDG